MAARSATSGLPRAGRKPRKRLALPGYDRHLAASIRRKRAPAPRFRAIGTRGRSATDLSEHGGLGRALLCQLEVTHDDGSTERFVSDSSWKMKGKPSDLFRPAWPAKCYDARREDSQAGRTGSSTTRHGAGAPAGHEPPRVYLNSQAMEPGARDSHKSSRLRSPSPRPGNGPSSSARTWSASCA